MRWWLLACLGLATGCEVPGDCSCPVSVAVASLTHDELLLCTRFRLEVHAVGTCAVTGELADGSLVTASVVVDERGDPDPPDGCPCSRLVVARDVGLTVGGNGGLD